MIAKYLQQRFGQDKKFYAYIAGVYNVLNARSAKEAVKSAEKRRKLDEEKKRMLNKVMERLGVNGDVLTTYDLWNDGRYWEIVDRLFYEGVYDEIPDEYKITETAPLRKFPLEILGTMDKATPNVPRWIKSKALYVPAEVAEALWLQEKYGVEWKIGPPSEEIYDQLIWMKSGMGIVRTKQPQALVNGEAKDVMPYIGKPDQTQRILFSDTPKTLVQKCWIGNPSYDFALGLADVMERLSGSGNCSGCFPREERIWNLISLGR